MTEGLQQLADTLQTMLSEQSYQTGNIQSSNSAFPFAEQIQKIAVWR